MQLRYETLALTLAMPFTISRGTQLTAENVKVELSDGTTTGTGEAAPSDHYGELQGTVCAFLDALSASLDGSPLPISVLHEQMNRVAHLNPAAKAAVDMAAYDLLGKRLGAPVYEMLGLDPDRAAHTSYTIGIDTPEIMARKAADAAPYPILKIKVGTPRDIENLEAIRAVRPEAIIRVDANEAWTAKEAVERIEEILPYDIEFVEQPARATDLEGLGYIRDAVPVPVIADESCVVPADVPRIAPYVDGINIKLMKCGGLYPALQMIHLARGHHLKIMMGCMIESSISITAAAHLSPLLDYADLDGNLLISDDPYRGVTVQGGQLILPREPGLGLSPTR
jgi:L-alanine-DL-glutamate epimerase-like enolase superfamily enzyme